MPYEIIGRNTLQHGKALWEILGKLRNHGVGRIVVRNQFEKYPEPSWYRILEVQPLSPQGKVQVIPPLIDGGEVRCVRVLVDKVYRGKYHGRGWIGHSTYKPDYKLIPKEGEEKYTKVVIGGLPEEFVKNIVMPSQAILPPLLRETVIQDLKAKGRYTMAEPMMDLPHPPGVQVAKQGESPTRDISPHYIKGTLCPSLYASVTRN